MASFNSTVKNWLIYLFPLVFVSFSACIRDHRKANLNNDGGISYLLQVSIKDIIKANTISGYEIVDSVLNSVDSIENSANGTFIEIFVTELFRHPSISTVQFQDLKKEASEQECQHYITKKTNEATEKTREILLKRIDMHGIENPSVQCTGNNGRIIVELPGMKPDERLEKLLLAPGKLEFWETYDNAEIGPILIEANELLKGFSASKSDSTSKELKNDSTKSLEEQIAIIKQINNDLQEKMENTLFGRLAPSTTSSNDGLILSSGATLGYASAEDTMFIMRSLLQPETWKLFPENLRLAWSSKPIDQEGVTFQLIALKSTSHAQGAAMTGNIIKHAKKDMRDGPLFITMEMTEAAADDWSVLTRNNINKSIAIVIDNKVLSYPIVQGEIRGGISSITGSFTQEEADDFATILNSGCLPASVFLLKKKTVLPLNQ
jgi:SecD/SecF fusion protein